MIDTLITALSKELELSAEEIADTIWLALQIQESQSESTATEKLKNDLFQPSSKNEDLEGETLPETPTQTSDSGETVSKQSPDEHKAGIYPRNQQETLSKSELSFKVPDAPSLREPLTLARALKPLMRRIPSGTILVLDEAATIQRIANEGLWLPVLRPTLEPWFDLDLVVDEGISMQIWRYTIRELERLLKNYGIFRDVRVWGLITDNLEQVQIRRGIGATAKNQSPRSPAELIDPSGRRLVLVVSDCVSSLWRDGKVTTTLEIWAKQGSMAIVQMLPKWLWKRTALGRASEVRLQGLNPGEFNQKLIAKEVSLWDELEETRGVKVPVFTLEPDKVATWAQMLSGKGGIWTSGYVFKLDPIPVNKGRELFNLNYNQQSAEQRVQAFRVTASPMARKLAGLLAAAPVISLPIVRLIQRTLLKESQQVHVAEVFLGGLLKPLSEINAETNPDYVQYEFMDGVRELLLDSVPSGYVLNVVDEVSKYVARKVGLSLENFAAVLRNPQQVRDSNIAGDVGYFAKVTAQVLRRLGGEYVKVAEKLELNDSVKAKKTSTNISTSETFQHGYALLIGVGECQYKPLSLPITVKDTQAIYATLVDQDLCAYPDDPEHIRVLNNEQATRVGIVEGLQWLKQKAEEDSEATVFVYYSGHGWVNKTDNCYYLVPHDVDMTQLAASALSAEKFTEEVRQIKSERLLVTIDAAHSGNMGTFRHSEEVGGEFLNDFGDSHNISLFKKFSSSLKQGEGRMIFTSSQGDQKCWIKKDGSLSIYTFHFLEALMGVANQDGDTTIHISNLMQYLSETVPKTAKKLYDTDQTPHFDVNGSNFVIAKLRGGKGLPNVPLLSEKEIDYTKLRKLLITQNWKESDEETTRLMLQVSGQEERGWLDWEDLEKFPSTDLETIDQLWLKYSNGHFGFSVQKTIWQELGEQVNVETERKLGERLGWFNLDEWWLDYSYLTFSLDAPKGHLPANWDCEGIDGQEAASTCWLMSRLVSCVANQQVDYTRLRNFLAAGKWKGADIETARLIFKIVDREKQGWLRVEDIEQFPSSNLRNIDRLWVKYSNGKFGFSVQKRIYQSLGGTQEFNQEITESFWKKVGWIVNNQPYWSQYDNLTFNRSAPIGHLPIRYDVQRPSRVLGVIERLLSRDDLDQDFVSLELQTFEFQTIMVNSKGEIIKNETKTAKYFTENLPNNIPLEMVDIPGSKFMMGSPEGEANDREKPQHEVIVQPFFIGKYLVTQAQWRAVANLPIVNRVLNPDPSHYKGDNRPVENVSWNEAVEFCDRLSLYTEKHYRLPSEAEWEYACRAGTSTPFHFGETLTPNLAIYASNRSDWHSVEYNSKNPTSRHKIVNNFGLFDMHGTLWEWCADAWHNNYEDAPLDGSIWLNENYKQKSFQSRFVVRGGSWGKPLDYCRSAYRDSEHSDYKSAYNGFRIVCVSETTDNDKEEVFQNILDCIITEHSQICESLIKEKIHIFLVDKTIDSLEIPDDNNEATITGVGEPYDIELEAESTENNGRDSLFLIRFNLTVECELSYYIFKANYYTIDDEKVAKISISDWNKHYFRAEEFYPLNVEGLISVKCDSKLLELSLISNEHLLAFLEKTDISINEITQVEINL